ncbi:hypothetical protein G6F57_003639 [Rhizopus arrhizus]|uniref:Uncharacterized protein n=1 Tax=Rhizopus oryzae TaxID=64495 RepID=A0A9P6XBB0_RHIOR|nr:hypothetical protein G6F23_002914 [Rhizopus arrhizus]KAG1417557.1 hypothetical protein G6F58_005462 [Rhizopus delemar]KAG0764686.1 hypothetical protein G6F24_005025 [Rhizopus arrhizus]KAG0781040.1 hypothetical protein G6F22_009764 [Rhizopus arrhizus]KAG0791328.1 hypothetical protein G6F21_005168 [Rhizopus arrhizus]
MSEISISATNNPLLHSKEKLIKLYGVDLFAAASSSAMVAPFIAIVDRSIIENLNGKRPLKEGLRYGIKSFISQPLNFVTSAQFRLVLGLYFSTYTTANIIDTTCEQYSVDPSQSAMYKFMSTSAVNMLLCIYKDRVFAKMFGVASTNKALPKLSYFLFAARDALTIAASFNAPSYIAERLQNNSIISNPKTASVVSQLACPAAVQFISTPVHLYALDIYNRPLATTTRIGRIGPAFGIGGVGNSFVRNYRNKI